MTKQIETLFHESRRTYGTRRIQAVLLSLHGLDASRRRIGRRMKAAGLQCRTRRKFTVTTHSRHNLPVAPNLLQRQFDVMQPNLCRAGDITCIPTEEGWLCLAVVIDLFSRLVAGRAMEGHMKAELVNDALLMAVRKRKPPKGMISHSDRGSQYACESHPEVPEQHGIVQSMSKKGDCRDNAVSESFFHTLKTEFTHHCKFKTREEAKQAIFEYIKVFYNRNRIHSTIGYQTPEQCDEACNEPLTKIA